MCCTVARQSGQNAARGATRPPHEAQADGSLAAESTCGARARGLGPRMPSSSDGPGEKLWGTFPLLGRHRKEDVVFPNAGDVQVSLGQALAPVTRLLEDALACAVARHDRGLHAVQR